LRNSNASRREVVIDTRFSSCLLSRNDFFLFILFPSSWLVQTTQTKAAKEMTLILAKGKEKKQTGQLTIGQNLWMKTGLEEIESKIGEAISKPSL
jgi:hypothetical protein